MSVDIATFRLRFTEFSDETLYPDPRIQLFLDDSILYLGDNESRWNGKYNLAQSYLAAHLLTVGSKTSFGDSGSTMGTITNKSAGGVSVSRSVSSKDRSDLDEWYLTTSYGQQFVNIRNLCFVGVMVANQL